MSTTPYRWRWLAFAVILTGTVMDLLDSTVVNVAAPNIRTSLGGSYSALQWISAGYTLAMAVMLITGGRLGDLLGRKRMFLVGAAGFTLASIACALSANSEMLIAGRVLQGALGAVMVPQGLGMIREMFPPKEMAAAFGLFGPVIGIATLLGPIVAGGLIDADLFGTGWRMIFLINAPLGLAAVYLGIKYLPNTGGTHSARLDVTGMVLVTAASLMLIYPLIQGRELGWPAWTFALIAGSVLLFAGFIWHSSRRGLGALVPISLLRKRQFVGGIFVALVFFGSVVGFMLTFGVFVQVGLGYSPLRASLTMTPMALGSAMGAGLGGAVLGPKFGRHTLHAGLAIMAVGVIGLALTLQRYGTGIHSLDFAPAATIAGIGMGLVFAPVYDIILASVDDQEIGSASGVLSAMQQLGSALGVAIIGTVFFGLLGSHAGGAAGTVAPGLRTQLSAAGIPAGAQAQIVAGFRTCLHDRETQKDPSATPRSCQTQPGLPALPQQAQRALATAGIQAHRRSAVASAQTTSLVSAGALGLTFLLAFLLPRAARPQEAYEGEPEPETVTVSV
jgi:EmrB/QacA subfamily drug resistance transporter